MNYMAEVAKMLGVELGEEFEIDFGNGISTAIAYLDDTGLKVKETNMIYMPNATSVFFEWLLCGLAIIKRKPWKPKHNQDYWAVTATDGVLAHNKWTGCWMDITYYKLGNCYRTKAEAEANRNKWIEFYASDEVLET